MVAALVEQRLSLVPEVQHGVESRRARAPHANLPSVRELRIGLRVLVVTSYQRVVVQNPQPACVAVLPRRTVLKPQLLLFVTCVAEANALRKSR